MMFNELKVLVSKGLQIVSYSNPSKWTKSPFMKCVRMKHSKLNTPASGVDMAKPGGIASMMRLPVASSSEGLDACFVGIPIDHGTSYRSGARMGPRQIRCESSFVRKCNVATGASPYESLMVADIGDVWVNLYNLPDTCRSIRESFAKIIKNGCIPIAAGGDHTITYPILQAMAEKYGPLGLVHVDAHSDCSDTMLGEKIAHGTPFRRSVEEGILDCKRVVQIGLVKTSGNFIDDYKFQLDQGFRIVPGRDCWHKSLTPLMEEVREQMGDGPVYLSFDIDSLDPAFAPGTGTPEIGGLTTIQGMEIIQGCKGLNLVGCDLVEVSPPYDPSGNTALIAANLMFEMLCVLPGVKYAKY